MDDQSAFVLPRWIIEMESFPQFRLLDRLVKEPSFSVTSALEQFSALTSAAPSSGPETPLGIHPWHTWCSLLEVAQRTEPEKQSKLVEFVTRVQKTKLHDPTTGQQMKNEGYLIWTELPALGYTVADEWNAFDVTKAGTAPEARRRYENMISLLAQLSSAADVDYTKPGALEPNFSFWSMRAFKGAFEPRVPTDSAVRTACMWLIYAPRRLWANIQHGQVFGRRGNNPGTVMTRDMWDSWVEGLRRAKEVCQDPETCDMVDVALGSMSRVED